MLLDDYTQGVARRLALPWAIIFRAFSSMNRRQSAVETFPGNCGSIIRSATGCGLWWTQSLARRVMRFFSMARQAVLLAARTRLIKPANRASFVKPCL